VISGGGTGIGAAAARALCADGYEVLIVGRRPEVLEKAVAALDGASAVAADLSDPTQVARVVAAVGDRPVDAVVNNAGGFVGSTGPDGLAGTAQWWRRNLDANVLTAVLLTEALRPRLRRPGGRIILVSSIAAQRGGGGPYSAAKAALHGWAYDLAAELGPEGGR
jgi:3-oxoacyl-[acyl-carrier protein] reductase